MQKILVGALLPEQQLPSNHSTPEEVLVSLFADNLKLTATEAKGQACCDGGDGICRIMR